MIEGVYLCSFIKVRSSPVLERLLQFLQSEKLAFQPLALCSFSFFCFQEQIFLAHGNDQSVPDILFA